MNHNDTNATGPLVNVGDHRVRPTEREAGLNVHTVLQLCAAGKLRCSEKTNRPTSATVRTVASNLAGGDFYVLEPIASFAWPLLVQAGGLASLQSGRLQLTTKGRAALGQPAGELLRGLWRRWLSHAVIDEFTRIDQIKGQRSKNVLSAAKRRRQAVADALATCQPGEWVDVDTFFVAMRRGNMSPTITRNERALWKLYIEDAQYGSLGYDGYGKWEMLEGRYTLAVLFEYAATLGMLDLDYIHPTGARDDFHDNWGGEALDALSRYDGLGAIRLTELGRYSLGLVATYAPTVGDSGGAALKILPNLDVVATNTISAGDELVLSAYAERTADRVWTVSATTLLAALDNGRDLAEFTAFLTRRGKNALPTPLETLIDDVARRASHLNDLGPVRVLECADPAVARLLSHDRALKGLCKPIGDRHLAVPVDQEPRFRKALLKLGYVMPSHGTT